MANHIGTILPYALIVLLIVSPRSIRRVFRAIRPAGVYSGWPYSDWFMRLLGGFMLAVFLTLELHARR
jgi:hypothetical protein